MFNLNLL